MMDSNPLPVELFDKELGVWTVRAVSEWIKYNGSLCASLGE